GNIQFIEKGLAIVDSNFFNFFGFKLLSGNPASVLNSSSQIVLTESLAIKYFGKENPIGKTIIMDGKYPMVVSGVAENAPSNSHIEYTVIVPYSFLRKKAHEEWQAELDTYWSGGWPYVYVQLVDPSKAKELQSTITGVVKRFAEKEWKENKMSYEYFLQPVSDIHLKSHLRYDAPNNGSLARVNIFSIVGIIVLLLACINYINLTTATAVKRAKETSVRKVIGATRPQLIRQFFSETFIICTLAVFLGVIIFKTILPQFSAWIGQPYYFPLNPTTILILLAFIVFISAIAGIYPSAILSAFNPAV